MGSPWKDGKSWALVATLEARTGHPLRHLLLAADADELKQTRQAQLSTFLTSMLVLRSLPDLDVVAVAGHSLGEYSALVAAGALTVDQGARLVAERGEAMRAAATARPGTMAAVLGLRETAVATVLDDLEDVWAANYNAPAHVVVSGTKAGVAAATEPLRAAGARRVLPLPVGGAFHTELMQPARVRLEAALAATAFSTPLLPVIANVTARPHDADITALLSAQLTAPVLWMQSMHALRAVGVELLVEVGPGGVLTGLAKRTVPEIPAVSVSSPEHLEQL